MDKKSTNGIFARIKYVKNIEFYILAGLCLILLLVYFSGGVTTKASATDEEARLAATLSEIKGAGKVSCMITLSDEGEVEGVVVVAEGAKDINVRLKLINAACFALNIKNTRVEVFEMK